MKSLLILLFLPLCLHAQGLHAESYTFSTGKGNVALFVASKIVQKAYTQANISTDIQFMNLQDSLIASNSGQTDGEVARIKKISRLYPNLLQVPVSIAFVEAVAFSKKTDLKIESWADLRGHDFTVVKGAKFIEIATKDMSKNLLPTFSEAFDLLNDDETDIVIAPKLAGLKIILNKQYINIKAISPSLQKVKLYHFVHKKNAHLIPIITPYFKAMEKSGEIAHMREQRLQYLVTKKALSQ